LLEHTGNASLNLGLAGPGSSFENLTGGTYSLDSDAGIFGTGCCGPIVFDNYGLFRKSAGTGNSLISAPFNNLGGTVDVETGTLTLANNGHSLGGTWTVANGATLDVTGGANPSWGGHMTGTGSGQVLLSHGTLSAAPSLDLDFADHLFQWAGGKLTGPVTNLSVITVSGTNTSVLTAELDNLGLVRHTGTGGLGLSESGAGALLRNLPGAIYQFEDNGGLFQTDCCGPTAFVNAGLVRKVGGTNESRVDQVPFDNLGGTLEVDVGRLTLANSGTNSNGTLLVAAGARLDLTGGQSPTWAGTITATGAGRVELNNGQIVASPSLTLQCAPGLFQWTGGSFNGTVTNLNQIALSGGRLAGGFYNSGLFRHLFGDFNLSLSGNGSQFYNLPTGEYRFESDATIGQADCCGPATFNNLGLVRKTGGTNTTTISIAFNNLGGLVRVDTGTLILANSGVSSGSVFTAAANTVLDVTGGQSPTWSGLITGQGAGTVLLAGGTLNAVPSVALNFTNGLFQWTGGSLSGLTTNLGTLVLSGPGSRRLAGQFVNANLVRHTGTGPLALSLGGSGTLFQNLIGATYQFETDSSIGSVDCCGPVTFENDGLLLKSGGTSNNTLSVAFNNLGGAISVQTGRLTLANNGTSSSGTFTVAAGAAVDLTGGQQPTWSGRLAATGAGRLELNNGQVNAAGLSLDCAPGLFQWTGGTINGTVSNLNQIALSGGKLLGNFYNSGLVRHLNGILNLSLSGNGSQLYNLPGGEYRFESDASVGARDCCGTVAFNNLGLIRKSGGTNTTTISVGFNNQNGAIEVDSGTLALTGGSFAQGQGALTVLLGGTNAGSFGQLSVGANATLGGQLNVVLTNGFVPPLCSQFQVLACASRSGTFSTVAIPGGISINYSNNGVFLVVTGAVTQASTTIASQPLRILTPRLTGGQFSFSFSTVTGQVYLVERNDSLNPMNWVYFTNVLGNNSLIQIRAPITNTRSFFRLRASSSLAPAKQQIEGLPPYR
jgi:hypothetical protein